MNAIKGMVLFGSPKTPGADREHHQMFFVSGRLEMQAVAQTSKLGGDLCNLAGPSQRSL